MRRIAGLGQQPWQQCRAVRISPCHTAATDQRETLRRTQAKLPVQTILFDIGFHTAIDLRDRTGRALIWWQCPIGIEWRFGRRKRIVHVDARGRSANEMQKLHRLKRLGRLGGHNGGPPLDDVPQMIQIRVASLKSAWGTMCDALGLPEGWGPKLLRHSMATELRRRRVDPWELSGQLGHRALRTAKIYAAFDPSYLGTIRAGIEDVASDLRKKVGNALHPKLTRNHDNVAVLRA